MPDGKWRDCSNYSMKQANTILDRTPPENLLGCGAPAEIASPRANLS
jgi:hypothetical protein